MTTLHFGDHDSEAEPMTTELSVATWPKITVVVPIRNEERYISRTLEYLLMQDYPADRLEILVVDGESTDRTAEIVSDIAARDARVRLLKNPKRLSSAARGIGATQATGEIITFVDGHTYIDNNQLLKSTAKLLDQKQVKVLSRPQFLETPENGLFQEAVALARRSSVGHGLDSTIYSDQDKYVDPSSSGATYHREVFQAVGNFDDRFDACEDVEFNYRVAKAGFKSFTSMSLAVYYYPRESLKSLFNQMSRYGIGRFRLAGKHPGSLSIGTLIPFAFTFGLPALALAGLASESLRLVAALCGLTYLSVTLGTSVLLAARHGVRYLALLPPIFWTIHVGLGYGFGVELGRSIVGKGVKFDGK